MITNQKYRYPFYLFLIMMIGLSTNNLRAQVSPQMLDYPNNHLPWFTIESEHFLVHYQKGSSKSAQLASKYAEEIYEPITSLYNHHPQKKVSIVLRDREDFSNGAAFFFDDKIEIWVPALDTPLRGTHYWLQNVITHEFTHIVQLGASMRRSQRIPAIYLQWLSYEDVRRPDVLYGFPNGIITMPFATVSVPAWFVEGTAQYQRSGFDFDYWDSHRDMILRTRVLDESYLGFTEMGTFTSKTSIERETVYNQGFNFTIYLVDNFGEEILGTISQKAAESGKNDFSKVLKLATGTDGQQLFDDWIETRKEFYTNQIRNINETATTIIEPSGFFNFYPQFSEDGSWFGYISNRGRDAALTSLILRKNDREITVDDVGGFNLLDDDQTYRANHNMESNISLDFISNRFSFSPDNQKVAFSKAQKNRFGETYQDIYVYDLSSETVSKITESARVQDPVWHPKNQEIIAVQQKNGSQNLVIVNIESGSIQQLTNFQSGETVFTPVWTPEGDEIYFATAHKGNRNIFRYLTETETLASVFEDDFIDFRDPWISPDGEFLYYSSDKTGIFNIYRKEIENRNTQKLTDVLGGAFMPHAKNDTLTISQYFAGGYKIAHLPIEILDDEETIDPVIPDRELIAIPFDTDDQQSESLKDFDQYYESNESISFQLPTDSASDERTWRPYSETTTGLSIFPVVRFDNYSKLRGSNSNLLWNGRFGSLSENLWRDVKFGAYLSSRDVTENISIFGGALLGLGSKSADGIDNFFAPSRINELDRDIFMIIEHQGIPFIKRSWSPTISLEVYNLKRNVRDGLSIEEFACTACLPEDRTIDIRYNIWEANLFLRSKLNRWSMLEFGASYSPYSVTVDGFFSDEFREFIPSSTSQYFRGSSFSASYITDLTIPERHSDISPRGLKGSLTYSYQPARLLDSFEINDGILSPVFQRNQNHSIELQTTYGLSVTNKTNALFTARGFTYLNNPDDFFYLDYIGGLIGMRSYPFFSIGGQTTAYLRSSVLRPIVRNINQQFGAYTFDKLYAHLFFEAGNGWGGPLDIGNNLKTGVGAELRFAFNSYYLFPMKFFINSTYGFNRFDVNLPTEFISTTGQERSQYGRELLFYFGLTFDFDLL